LFAAVKDVIAHVNAESPKVARQKWDVVCIAVARKCSDIGYVFTFGSPHSSGGFFHPCARFCNLRVRAKRELYTFLTGGTHGTDRNVGIEHDLVLEWKTNDVVKLHAQIR